MTDITIPPEAEEAVAEYLWVLAHPRLPWSDANSSARIEFRAKARAALRAGIAAWSGMAVNDGCPVWHAYPHIILPLPQEPRDE